MKNLENSCGYYQRTYQRPHEDNDPSKPQLYWDGYQWVIRPSGMSSLIQDPIKPGRKVQIANVPLQLNLQITLFKEFILSKMIERNVISRRDTPNISSLIGPIEFKPLTNTAILVMESIDLAKKMILIDGIILLGHTLRVSLFKEVNGNEMNLNNINKEAAFANSAHISAKSAAISYAAFQSILNKNQEGNNNNSNSNNNTNNSKQKEVVLNLKNNDAVIMTPSKVIKVMNVIDEYKFKGSYSEVYDDIKEEMERFGNVVSGMIVKPGKERLGKEVGAIFIEFQDVHDAEVCYSKMKGKEYDKREMRIAFIDEDVYRKEIID
jgi:hypothetical protein